ncbi:aromatic prenyltransferase [Astrocystis sublimbata]|nr:aromatic prenyltransferase [Astrocystis sublimbata]
MCVHQIYITDQSILPPQQNCLPSTGKQLQHKTTAFTRVESECTFALDHHARYWWETSGYALAILLNNAGYSEHGQILLLKFFRAIAPVLGPAYVPERQQWKSFMTDNHNPIELSWDWRVGEQSPKIRFSIEPVGLDAGTYVDPDNRIAGAMLKGLMMRLIPQTNLAWLEHFQRKFNGDDLTGLYENHPSKEFYAFDLEDTGIISKAYFFPKIKARQGGYSTFEIISNAIETAPGNASDKSQGLDMFQAYVQDPSTPSLDISMFAIDLIQSMDPRFKIYFRNRSTSFQSIKDTICLGHRISDPNIELGLQRLRLLYRSLFGIGEEASDDDQLFDVDHPTAGILYNVDIRRGTRQPNIKVYLPVRHYAPSEDGILSALESHMSRVGRGPSASMYMAQYTDAIRTLFAPGSTTLRRGLHTYIACSIEPGAEFRVVSYLNPYQLSPDMTPPCLAGMD